MPESRAVFFPRKINENEMRDFVAAEGGKWQDWDENPHFRQGVFVSDDALLFVRGVDHQQDFLPFYSHDDLEKAELNFGMPIVSMLTIDYSRNEAGQKLAKRIMNAMLMRWGGIDGENWSPSQK